MCSEIEKDENCIGAYNTTIMDPMEPSMRIILFILIIAGLFLDILCLKYRSIANAFIYLECAIRVIAMLIPNYANYQYTALVYIYMFG